MSWHHELPKQLQRILAQILLSKPVELYWRDERFSKNIPSITVTTPKFPIGVQLGGNPLIMEATACYLLHFIYPHQTIQ